MKMKTYTVFMIAGLIIVTLLIGGAASANSGHGREIEDILAEIREDQGVGPGESIDLNRVSDEHLEELGEAVMDIMHPNEREHEFMDQMMGGEGSESLEYMHRMMGYRYLSGDFRTGGDPMMGSGAGTRGFGMMGDMPMMGWGMHGRRGSGGFGALSGAMMGGFWPFFVWRIVMWIVVLGVIGVVVWLIVRTQKQHGGRGSLQGESPIDIVKARYARGEITREEFENLKRDLQ
jgi:uncharacterized membrane protein